MSGFLGAFKVRGVMVGDVSDRYVMTYFPCVSTGRCFKVADVFELDEMIELLGVSRVRYFIVADILDLGGVTDLRGVSRVRGLMLADVFGMDEMIGFPGVSRVRCFQEGGVSYVEGTVDSVGASRDRNFRVADVFDLNETFVGLPSGLEVFARNSQLGRERRGRFMQANAEFFALRARECAVECKGMRERREESRLRKADKPKGGVKGGCPSAPQAP